MQVRCTNKKCLHIWEYKGKVIKDKDYITCPKCHYRSMLKKALDRKKDIPLSIPSIKALTHSLTHSLIDTPLLNLTKLSPKMFGLEKEHTPYRKIIERPQTEFIEIEEGSNLCDIHNLPASYDDKVWTCRECRKIETPNAEPVIYPSAQINKIPKEEFKIIPRDPIKLLEHQRNFF